ncbi:protein of unknown function [Nitrospira defluvii]|uniref:Uncharacterized protein n=1 Tax=Nitrospira defluvii TaxID=330214 RepID=D8PEK5_9BACT|nr:protein of unknown function [Nitrospira defluvii]
MQGKYLDLLPTHRDVQISNLKQVWHWMAQHASGHNLLLLLEVLRMIPPYLSRYVGNGNLLAKVPDQLR